MCDSCSLQNSNSKLKIHQIPSPTWVNVIHLQGNQGLCCIYSHCIVHIFPSHWPSFNSSVVQFSTFYLLKFCALVNFRVLIISRVFLSLILTCFPSSFYPSWIMIPFVSMLHMSRVLILIFKYFKPYYKGLSFRAQIFHNISSKAHGPFASSQELQM